jgi:NADH-quinone oxidoreductase subunit E
MTEAQLFGIATFYAQFRLTPVGERVVKVCHGTACHVSGAQGLTEALEGRLQVKDGENTPDMKYTLTHVACVGCCSLAPVVMVDDRTYGRLDRKKAADIINQFDN